MQFFPLFFFCLCHSFFFFLLDALIFVHIFYPDVMSIFFWPSLISLRHNNLFFFYFLSSLSPIVFIHHLDFCFALFLLQFFQKKNSWFCIFIIILIVFFFSFFHVCSSMELDFVLQMDLKLTKKNYISYPQKNYLQ